MGDGAVLAWGRGGAQVSSGAVEGEGRRSGGSGGRRRRGIRGRVGSGDFGGFVDKDSIHGCAAKLGSVPRSYAKISRRSFVFW